MVDKTVKMNKQKWVRLNKFFFSFDKTTFNENGGATMQLYLLAMKVKMDAKVKDRSVVVIRCGGRGQTGEESRAPDLYPG